MDYDAEIFAAYAERSEAIIAAQRKTIETQAALIKRLHDTMNEAGRAFQRLRNAVSGSVDAETESRIVETYIAFSDANESE